MQLEPNKHPTIIDSHSSQIKDDKYYSEEKVWSLQLSMLEDLTPLKL